ncbi:MAG TPA: LLM class flavin-dependent oxidoreductase, partial [Actinomycetota bacterium]|nr:LLM class flavin-dependent oxidoreductase [Actinomycetota bacterium]
HYQVKGAINLPPAARSPRPKIFVGGKGDRVVSLAGRHADGYNAVWGWTPEALDGRFEVLDRAAREHQRDPAGLSRSVGLYVLAGADESEVNERWQRYAAATPKGVVDRIDRNAWMSDKLAGTYDQIASRIAAFEDIGVEEVILGFGLLPFQIADPSAVDDLARELIPRLKES